MKIIAHRGASADAPENTMAAFRAAWEQGADGLELDARMTSDRQVVVIHDESARRTTGHDGTIALMSGAAVRHLDAGSWKGASWKGEKIPFLREALAENPEAKLIFVEIKTGPEILPSLRADLAAEPHEKHLVKFLCFDPAVASSAKQFLIHYDVYLNVEPDAGDAESLVATARAGALDGLSLGWSGRITRDFCARIRSAGLSLAAWCVDDPSLAERVRPWGIEYLMTNGPSRILRALGR